MDTVKILLVEDNPDDADLLRFALEEAGTDGFELTCVDRLHTALEHLQTPSFNVVLLDLSLPDSSGLDTFSKLHAQAAHLPIVILSGLDDEQLAAQAVRKGAQDYIVKGDLEGRHLIRALRYAIERKRAETAIQEAERAHVVAQTAAAAAHEINQPLTCVIGNAELLLLQLEDLDEKYRSLLHSIIEAGQRINEIVKKMDSVKQYVTKPYILGINIVDLDSASQPKASNS